MARAVLGDEGLALRRPPGDAAHDAAVLPERHLQVALLEAARAVDDLDAAGAEDRARVAGAERRQRRQLRRDLLVDRSERRARRRSRAAGADRPGRRQPSA